MNLNDMSRKELKALLKDVEKALASLEDRRRSEALKALEDAAKEHGFSLSELTGKRGKGGNKAPSIAKYANPEDPSQTWTGKGRKPNWFTVALEAGKSPDDMTI